MNETGTPGERSPRAEVAETHTAIVFFAGDRAYKVKKAVDLGFLDYTEQSARRTACTREVVLNRRFAPDVYLGVGEVVSPGAEASEPLVVMRRMPADRRLSALVRAGADVDEVLRAVARRLSAWHAAAPHGRDVDEQGTRDALASRWEASFEQVRAKLRTVVPGHVVQVFGVDKFPRMTDYVLPTGVRIADADRVRLGAHLAEGTTVMHEGFVNFNAGTLGTSMVEGRISAGVVVGDGSDVGGGSSIMGTLSGGGKEVISVGERCLIGANARVQVVGFSFGGLVAAALAMEHGAVCSLALLGPAGHGGPRRPQGELRPWQPAHVRGNAQALDDALRHNLGVQMLQGAHSVDAAALHIHREACLRTRFRSKPLSRAGALPALLTRYAGRVLLAWGEHDVTAVPNTTRPLLAQRTDSSRFVVVPGAGHWVQYEAAAEINALLLQWLNSFHYPTET